MTRDPDPGSNLERLEDAGVIVKTPLPAAFATVLEGLSAEEVDVIVDVKRRLDEAGAAEGFAAAAIYTNFIVI